VLALFDGANSLYQTRSIWPSIAHLAAKIEFPHTLGRLLPDATCLSCVATFRSDLHRAVFGQQGPVGGAASNYRTSARFGHSGTQAVATVGWSLNRIQSLYDSLIVNDSLSHRRMFLTLWLVHAEPKQKICPSLAQLIASA